jgi:hypothetical protein
LVAWLLMFNPTTLAILSIIVGNLTFSPSHGLRLSAGSQSPETVKEFGLRDSPQRTQTTARTQEVESRREQRSRAPTVGALGAASAPAHAKYLHPCRQCRSNCREHGVLYYIDSVSSVSSVVNNTCRLIWIILSQSLQIGKSGGEAGSLGTSKR